MKTYQQVFKELKAQNRAALIPFFVIGDPDYAASLAIVKAAMDAGPDILELGVPFSDPIADGPTIQKADVRAIRSGMNTHKALEFIRELRAHNDVPIGLLMYYNLIHQYGTETFFRDFREAGVNSVLVADLSIDDAEEIIGPAEAAGLDTVFMVTPNTESNRMRLIASKTTGFIYGQPGNPLRRRGQAHHEAQERDKGPYLRRIRRQHARTRENDCRGRRRRRHHRLQTRGNDRGFSG
jgi:tryptophan synthase alpha chain